MTAHSPCLQASLPQMIRTSPSRTPTFACWSVHVRAALAADRFHAFGENELAERYYARALTLSEGMEAVPAERRLQWLKRLAALHRAHGDEEKSRLCAEQALQIARERGDAGELAELESFMA